VKLENLVIKTSPLTNRIFLGESKKEGIFTSDKKDVTLEVLLAVVEHGLRFKENIIIFNENGEEEFMITVKNITP